MISPHTHSDTKSEMYTSRIYIIHRAALHTIQSWMVIYHPIVSLYSDTIGSHLAKAPRGLGA